MQDSMWTAKMWDHNNHWLLQHYENQGFVAYPRNRPCTLCNGMVDKGWIHESCAKETVDAVHRMYSWS